MKALLVLPFLFFFSFAYAADSSSGCGLGWSVFKENTLVSSSLRMTTNGLFFNQTFGMTSGTSNCARHSIVKNESKGIHFAEANFKQLAVEMAQGQGEYLQGFAVATGYIGDMALFGKLVQANYERILPDATTTPDQMYHNFSRLF